MTPLETLIVTVVPLTAVTPAVGSWSMTMPFGCVDATRLTATLKPSVCSFCTACGSCRPIRLGTASRPLETKIVTVCPLPSCVPGPGFSAKTTFGGRLLGAVRASTSRPLVVDLDRSLLLAQPDHVGDDGLVVTAAEEVPGEQTADDEQQQQERARATSTARAAALQARRPPPPRRRRRRGGVAGSTRRCGPHVRGVRAHGRSSRARPPAGPRGGPRTGRAPLGHDRTPLRRRQEALGELPSPPVARAWKN